MNRTIVAAVVTGVLAFGAASPSWSQKPEPEAEQPPNLLIIVTDDQRADTLRMMDSAKANFDVAFRTAIVTTPNCCPSRASILSGRYSHNHGVIDNGSRDEFLDEEPDSLAPWLQQRGYYTAFIGKYLNGYRATEPVPPGWDEFYAYVWGDDGRVITESSIYSSFSLREKESGPVPRDEIIEYPNETHPAAYSTTLIGSLTARFIQRAHDPDYNPEGKPWAAVVFFNAPNRNYTVEPRYRDFPVPKWKPRPSYLEAKMSDKPLEVRRSPLKMRTYGSTFPRIREAQFRTLLSVDDAIERIFNSVDRFEERERTWGIFTSDNGVAWGEHHLGQKLHAFEESIRVPFRMSVPGVGGRVVRDALVGNIDIAPTALDVAGVQQPESIDGASLKALALGDGPCFCHRSMVIENRAQRHWDGLRTPFWTYVKWPSGAKELYDLRRDPYQLQNLASRRSRVVRNLDRRLRTLLSP